MKARTRLGVASLALALVVAPASAQNGHELLQRAVVSERNDAQLDGAIALYRRIVAEYSADHELAAEALLRLGGAYEATGSAEAAAAYTRLVRDYGDQAREVAAARERLAVLQPSAVATVTLPPSRRLILDTGDRQGRVTRDGKHLLRFDVQEHRFELVDIESGQVRPLVRGLASGANSVDVEMINGLRNMVLSRDGRKIAAVVPSTIPSQGGLPQVTTWNLRTFVVGADGSDRSLHTFKGADFARLYPFDWSPDGRRIWLWGLRRDQSAVIASVDIDGSFEVLKTLAWRNEYQAPSLSPDGRFIAYHDVDNREAPADIFVLSTDGGHEVRIENGANDRAPLFAPDGSGVVFESDRREGIRDLWFLPLTDGRPSGAARIVWRDVAPYSTARAFADNGSLFYYFASTSWKLFVSDLDLAAGTIGEPKLVQPRGQEMDEAPVFSPDGRFLAHMRGRGRRVVVRDLGTGAEREFPTGGSLMFPEIDWCPGSDVAFVTGYQRQSVVLRMDLEQGGAQPIRLANAERVLCVGNGDDIVYLQAASVVGGPKRIVRRSLSTGVERTLFEGKLVEYQVSRSNDGAKIAFVERGEDQVRLRVVPATGGEARTLVTGQLFHGYGREWSEIAGVMWEPGDDALLITRHAPEGSAPGMPLSRVRLSDGSEAPVGRFRLPAFEGGFYGAINWAMNPTGSSFAFQRHTGTAAQVWAIDNLMDFINTGQTAASTPGTSGR